MSAESNRKKFLIVDDSAVQRALVRGLIRKHWPNSVILEAPDGEDGLRAIESESPDLAQLPQLD